MSPALKVWLPPSGVLSVTSPSKNTISSQYFGLWNFWAACACVSHPPADEPVTLEKYLYSLAGQGPCGEVACRPIPGGPSRSNLITAVLSVGAGPVESNVTQYSRRFCVPFQATSAPRGMSKLSPAWNVCSLPSL